MADGAYGKYGIARTYALVFGIAYLAVALTEAIAQSALKPILQFTGIQNAIHWTVGAAALLSFFGGEATAKLVARAIGIVFVVVTVFGVVARGTAGDVLGFPGALPWSYNVVHALTAVAALYAGFAMRELSTARA